MNTIEMKWFAIGAQTVGLALAPICSFSRLSLHELTDHQDSLTPLFVSNPFTPVYKASRSL